MQSKKIRVLRAANSWSQEELAQVIRSSRGRVGGIEAGKRQPNLDEALALSAISSGWIALDEWAPDWVRELPSARVAV